MTTSMPETLDVFVYGSLRGGLHNQRMFGDDTVAGPYSARVHGYDLYSNRSGTFPYLAVGSRTVVGELLTVRWGRRLQGIINMEEGAGYDTRVGRVEVEQADGSWAAQDAILFVHNERWKHGRGPLVEGGDWVEYLAAQPQTDHWPHFFTRVERPAPRPLGAPLNFAN